MIRPPPRSTRTDTLFPYTTLFRSLGAHFENEFAAADQVGVRDPVLAPRLAVPGDRLDIRPVGAIALCPDGQRLARANRHLGDVEQRRRSEEHTSELQSLMRISYAVFCLKKKTKR